MKKFLWALVDRCHVALAEWFHGPALRREAELHNAPRAASALPVHTRVVVFADASAMQTPDAAEQHRQMAKIDRFRNQCKASLDASDPRGEA